MLRLWVPGLLVLLVGCERDLYEATYAKPSRPITCIDVEADEITRYVLLKNPILKTLQKRECPFALKVTSRYITSCTSAQAKALGSDFDGFLRLELYEDGRLLYRNQQDFKGCLTGAVVDRLVDKMKERYGL
jgi:hypothetical protein